MFEFGVSNERFEDDMTIGIAKIVKMNNLSFELITHLKNNIDISKKKNCRDVFYNYRLRYILPT